MQSLSEIRATLEARGLAPRHALGQNFLVDHNLLRKLVATSGVAAGDLVLEVGPGTGTLTIALLEAGTRVIACELDRGLCALLRDTIEPRWPGAFTLIEGDCLAGKRALSPQIIAALGPGPFRLVSNLPYGAATPLLLTLLIDHPACASMTITIQKEVAERITAQPGTRDYGALSVIAQRLCAIERIATLPPACFWPRPKVDSAMLHLARRRPPPPEPPRALADACARLFANRRKQIRAAAGDLLGRPELADIDPSARAEALSPAQIARIAIALNSA
ncbi:MAG: 16S rRNA (adenine(1518)-N(6)/adenine(1519)-N(6))-dimethyltransferase RsmA [Phycisphaerales bacterium JB039]